MKIVIIEINFILSRKIVECFEVKSNKTPEINYKNLTKKDIARIQAVYLGYVC